MDLKMSGELPKLKLFGDKITIENRPLNKLSTASSKSLLLSNFRSASTVPSSFNEENTEKIRRPFSADYRYKTAAFQSESASKEQSVDSLDGFQEELNSAVLLKNMISEPISTWNHKTEQELEIEPEKSDFSEKTDCIDAIHDYLTLMYEKPRKTEETDLENDKTNVKIQNWMQENEEMPNLSDLDIDALFRDETDEKFEKFFKFTEENPKTDEKIPKKAVKTIFRKKPPEIPEKPLLKPSKVRFTAKPMKSACDFEEKTAEIDSWMTEKSKISEDLKKDNKDNFLSILESVNELKETVSLENLSETMPIPEKTESPDDLTSILQVLEEEDKKSQKTMETVKQLMTKTLPENPAEVEEQKCEENPKIQTESSKFSDLLSFLDEVDKKSSETPNLPAFSVKFNSDSLKLDTVPKLEDLLSYTTKELSKFVIDLSLRLKDKSSSIVLLQSELSGLREEAMSQTRKTEGIIRQKLKVQKEEYEGTIKRHQKFIDQLISDKKCLSEKCKNLIDELKVQETRYNSNMKAMEHRHEVELQKMKDMQLAGEKIRRERWVESKTQKIKELTVKSIEPELQNMEKRQQQELADIRALHKRELEDLELKNVRKMQEQCERIRMQLVEEREKTLAHEREVIRQRYEKLVETEEKGYQEQRRRLLVDHTKRVTECEEREKAVLADKEKGIRQVREEYEEKLQVALRKQTAEISCIKDNLALEMETWQNNFKKQQTLVLNEKETAIKQQCRRERDREIENVIERFEAEAQDMKMQQEQSTENRIRRLKEKYEKEIQDLELLEKETSEKCLVLKKQLIEKEDTVIDLKANLKQIQNEMQDIKEIKEKLEREREEVRVIIRREMEQDIDLLRKELAVLRKGKDEEVQQIYSRVKISMTRKDQVLNDLLKDYKCLQEKCAYLESMLEQQRKEYLMK